MKRQTQVVRRPPLRVLPLLGLALAGGAPASAAPRAPVRSAAEVLPPPWEEGRGRHAERAPRGVAEPPPWEEAAGGNEVPGRPGARPGEDGHEGGAKHARGRAGDPAPLPAGRKDAHPAVHGERRRAREPLFPRAARSYTVRPGDTLWDIATAVLATDDTRRVARYWPRIHRANRALIGPDPNVIFPGQRLRLPAE